MKDVIKINKYIFKGKELSLDEMAEIAIEYDNIKKIANYLNKTYSIPIKAAETSAIKIRQIMQKNKISMEKAIYNIICNGQN